MPEAPRSPRVEVPESEAIEPEAPELAIALSPRQVLGGFALLAGLLLLLFRRRKKGKG